MGIGPMTSRERVTKALRFEHPDRAPRDLWMLPGIQMLHAGRVGGDAGAFPIRFHRPRYDLRPGGARTWRAQPDRRLRRRVGLRLAGRRGRCMA